MCLKINSARKISHFSNKEIKYGTATEAYHAYLAEIEKNFG
jgi:hypothetical protein